MPSGQEARQQGGRHGARTAVETSHLDPKAEANTGTRGGVGF